MNLKPINKVYYSMKNQIIMMEKITDEIDYEKLMHKIIIGFAGFTFGLVLAYIIWGC